MAEEGTSRFEVFGFASVFSTPDGVDIDWFKTEAEAHAVDGWLATFAMHDVLLVMMAESPDYDYISDLIDLSEEVDAFAAFKEKLKT